MLVSSDNQEPLFFFVGAKIQHILRTMYRLTTLSAIFPISGQKARTTLATAANVVIILHNSKHSAPYLYI